MPGKSSSSRPDPLTRLPVTVLTGFLGSGKTTLLKAFLAGGANRDTAVIINEFGEVGLDHHLVESVTDDMVVLSGGCICCTVNGALPATLQGLREAARQGRIPPFTRVLIETTGLADPGPLIQSLALDPGISAHFQFDRLVTVVDATQLAGQLASHPETEQQLMLADVLVLSKTDLLTDRERSRVKTWLSDLHPHARLLDGQSGQALAQALHAPVASAAAPTSPSAPDPAQGWAQRLSGAWCTDPACNEARHGHAAHVQRYRSTAFRFDTPLDWEAVSDWIAGLCYFHGDRILRMKGVLRLQDDARPVVIHSVRTTLYPSETLSEWGRLPRRSEIVFITDGLDEAQLAPPFS